MLGRHRMRSFFIVCMLCVLVVSTATTLTTTPVQSEAGFAAAGVLSDLGETLVPTAAPPTPCPTDPAMHSHGLRVLSEVFGWVYFIAWSVSFIPQVVLNWRRKSVVGLSFEFLMYNLTGFLWYTTSSSLNFWAERHYHLNCGKYSVQVQDLCFGVFATVMTILTIAQCCVYERSTQKINVHHVWICGCMWIVLFYNVLLCSFGRLDWVKTSNANQSDFTLIQYMGVVKAMISLIKGLPQAYMNYKRKSTVGWSVTNICLDVTGGTLSLAQMLIDAYNTDSWNTITLNIAKPLLSCVTLLMDGVFLTQHYILYTDRTDPDGGYMLIVD